MDLKHSCCENCPCTRELLRRSGLTNEQFKCDYKKVEEETRQYKTKCNLCKMTIQRIRNILDDIVATQERSSIAGTCRCGRKVTKIKHCNKCVIIASKHYSVEQKKTKIKSFTEWLIKLKYLLKTLLQSHSICQHMTCRDTELERILKEIQSPICRRRPQIEYFPNIEEDQSLNQSITENKDLLEKLLSRIEPESDDLDIPSNDSTSTASCIETCICKLLKKEAEVPTQEPSRKEPNTPTSSLQKLPVQEKSMQERNNNLPQQAKKETLAVGSVTQKSPKQIPSIEKDKVSTTTTTIREKKIKITEAKTKETPAETEKRQSNTPELKSIYSIQKELKLKEKQEQKQKEKSSDKNKLAMKSYDKENDAAQKYIDKQLADALAAQSPIVDVKSSTIVECEVESTSPKYIVKSCKLKPYDSQYHSRQTTPLCPRKEFVFDSTTVEIATNEKKSSDSLTLHTKNRSTSGVISYQLSNKSFIENGWTQLPQAKTMRRMNLYRIEPFNEKNNWFQRNKNSKNFYYDSRELLAKVDENGNGVWLYKNGSKALEYYSTKENDHDPRCIVYSCTGKNRTTKENEQPILAEFDFLGNGVIYDFSGKVRMKYNQSEGVVVDPKIGCPCRWKWHDLNDPPVLKIIMVDSHQNPKDSYIENLKSEASSVRSEPKSKPDPTSPKAISDQIMMQLEGQKLVKNKQRAHCKQFILRTKVAKLNDYFAVRIFDQTKIYLTYRNGPLTLKLNLGMVLHSTKIIGYHLSEANVVEFLYPTN